MDPRTLPLPSSPPSIKSKKAFNKDLIRLNVGGARYEVSRDTLTRHEGSLLASLANSWNEDKFNNEIFIFRNGHLFAFVLDYLRSGKVHLPSSITRTALKDELDHFQIPADMSRIVEEKDYSSLAQLNREIKEHRAAIEEKEKEMAAIVESYRLAHQFSESVSKHEYNLSSFVKPSIPVKWGIDKRMLHECLLSRGLDAYVYQMEKSGSRVLLGPISEEEKRMYSQKPTGSPFRFFNP